VAQSDACLLIGARGESVAGLDCGGCSHARCEEMQEAQRCLGDGERPFCGPNSAKTAGIHNVDNRISCTRPGWERYRWDGWRAATSPTASLRGHRVRISTLIAQDNRKKKKKKKKNACQR